MGTPCASCGVPLLAVGPVVGPEGAADGTPWASRRGRPQAEPAWWLATASDASDTDPGPAEHEAVPATDPEAPGGAAPAWTRPAALPVAHDRALGQGRQVGQRWLVGLLVLVLGAGAVVVRNSGFAPAERRAAGARAVAPGTVTSGRPDQQQAWDSRYGSPLAPAQASRPGRTLPARKGAPVAGAAGSMAVRYGGWVWLQRLSGGRATPVAPVPDASVVALSPDGRRLALVRAVRGRPVVEVRTIGGRVHVLANGTGPAWSVDGRLAFVRTPGTQRAVTMTMSLSRNIPGPELRVVGGATWSTVPLPTALGEAQAGWTGDGNVVLLSPYGSMAGLFRVDVRRNRLESLSAARAGAALARGLPRPADAAGPLGAALSGVPASLVGLAPDGRRVALVTRVGGRARLEVLGSSGRTRIDLPADRFRSLHWAPGGHLVWLSGAHRLWAVNVANRRVVGEPGLPRGADLLGLAP